MSVDFYAEHLAKWEAEQKARLDTAITKLKEAGVTTFRYVRYWYEDEDSVDVLNINGTSNDYRLYDAVEAVADSLGNNGVFDYDVESGKATYIEGEWAYIPEDDEYNDESDYEDDEEEDY